MPTTLISPAQQRFIASLAAERVVPERHAANVLSAAAGTLARRDASQLIDVLNALPRRGQGGAERRAQGEPVPTPSRHVRAGRMLRAGGIEATVTLEDGRHVTVRLRSRRQVGRGWANCAPTDEGARSTITISGQRVGWVNVGEEGAAWTLTTRTRREEFLLAIDAVFDYASAHPLPDGVASVLEASRCGRCMRTLTDPVSIQRGIGPECYGRVTGSRHVAADRETVLEAITSDGLDALSIPASGHTHSAVEEPITVEPTTAPRFSNRRINETRDMIAEALDSYFDEDERDRAMRVFDQLAAESTLERSSRPTEVVEAEIVPF